MITIKNRTRRISVETEKIKATLKKLLSHVGYENFDLGLLITTNNTIQKFNKEYRQKDQPTDILSFPYHQLKPGQKIEISTEEDKNLGDIIISLEYAKKWANENNTSFAQHLNRLLVHGLCHLLGYTHETDQEFEIMNKKEQELLALLKKEITK